MAAVLTAVVDGFPKFKTNPPGSPTGSGGSLTDEACATPFIDHAAAAEMARRYAEQRDVLERRVAEGHFEIGDCTNKTRLIRRLGGGTFGEVYLGESANTGDPVAVKVELNACCRGSGRQQLLNEGSVYRHLTGGQGIPEVRWFGMHGSEYSALVMDLLGPTLYAVWAATGERFTIKTLLMLIDQTVETVGHVHHCGYVHRDISPSNFLLNATPKADRIQLIDFGQAKRVAGSPISGPGSGAFHFVPAFSRQRSNLPRPVVGTPRFASVWSHAGFDAAYRDDMESLGYLWIYLARGRLPWQGIRDCNGPDKIARIGRMKVAMSAEELCDGLPEEFVTYMHYVRSLKPYDMPDHEGVRELFRALADRLGVGEYDWDFDWSPSLTGVGSTDAERKYFFPPEANKTKQALTSVNDNDDAAGDADPSSSDEADGPSVTPVSK
jgi:casein kinase I family protein HRR25